MLKELIKSIKEDPKEAILSVLFVSGLFAFLYVALWIGCPCG